ncbi:DUF1080 domain-containing protein [Telmatospirillum sp. J64-1]|uniref:3-keto-disaccharide hydrolase n=1 Tax=Telmatospirillum sp. J64-1 TaxID=2502183 RepID=UPI00163D451A|nr:DUF1080 domain-containing protein [Telmatospirillum sp. J64-1]
MTEPGFEKIALDTGWVMAGRGRFIVLAPDLVQSEGGTGLYWYPHREFGDFVLRIEWMATEKEDNSGVFIRFPPLGRDNPDQDWKLAVDQGLEVQIDDTGLDPRSGALDQPLHRTGAIYGLAPAEVLASNPLGEWNEFQITAEGPVVTVMLNGITVAQLTEDRGRPRSGHLGLQNHHPDSRVRFRNLRIKVI